MGDLRTSIVDLLEQKNGNAQAVSALLGVSVSYINRIKRELAEQTAPLVKVEQPPLSSLVPNLQEVQLLRDETLTSLLSEVRSGLMSDANKIRLLQVLLKYEVNLVGVTRPTASYTQNNLNLVGLVDRFAGMTDEQLLAASGLNIEDDIIEGEIANGSKNAGQD